MLTVLVVALTVEMAGIMAMGACWRKAQVGPFPAYTGVIGAKPVVMVESGIGKVNGAMAAQCAILAFSPRRLVVAGTAGSLHPMVRIGDVVVGNEVLQHDASNAARAQAWPGDRPDPRLIYPCCSEITAGLTMAGREAVEKTCLALLRPCVHVGRIVTGDRVVVNHQKAVELAQRFRALAVEMEGAAVAQVAFAYNVAFGVIRIVSDLADANASADFHANQELICPNLGLVIKIWMEKYIHNAVKYI